MNNKFVTSTHVDLTYYKFQQFCKFRFHIQFHLIVIKLQYFSKQFFKLI